MAKATFILLLILCSYGYIQAQAPMDVGSIELLIDRHKKQHDRLEERNKEEIKHSTVTLLVKDIATKYETLHKDLNKKYAIASQWINLGIGSISLLTEVKELGKALPPFLSYAHKITNPFVLQKYLQAGKKIRNEIDFCIKSLTALTALRITAYELNQIIDLLKSHISDVRMLLSSYTMVIRGQIGYNDLFERPTLPDYASIANEVIREYYPNKKTAGK